jgi:hypothetical protein
MKGELSELESSAEEATVVLYTFFQIRFFRGVEYLILYDQGSSVFNLLKPSGNFTYDQV